MQASAAPPMTPQRSAAQIWLPALLALAACDGVAPPAQPAATPPQAAAAQPDSATRLATWQKRGFGMFMHWGLYSRLGGVWQGKPVTEGYSEQIQGWAGIPADDYAQVAASFDAARFDADAICRLAKDAGARYLVVTSKHHDGFAMFETASTDYDIVDRTPFAKDPLKLLSEACRRQGLGFGVYFSLVDWHAGHAFDPNNDNPIPAAMEPLIERQLRELMSNYGPIAEVWFDMSTPTPEQSRRFAAIVRELQPQAAINGRIWHNQGDFVTLGDNQSPPPTMRPPFEVPASIYHDTWGYRSWQQRDDLDGKVRELVRGLVDARAAGGNYLLNIGPMGDGAVVPFEAEVLRGIGAWIRRHRGVALDARPSGLRPQRWGATLADAQALYLFVRDWRGGELVVQGLANEPVRVTVDGLPGAPALGWQRRGDDLHITLPARAPDAVLPVLRVDLGGAPLRAIPAEMVRLRDDGAHIPYARWQAGTSFGFGSGYESQHSTTVRLATHVAVARARTVRLTLHGAKAEPQRRYRITIGDQAIELRGAELAAGAVGPLRLPVGEAVPLTLALAAPSTPAQDLGLTFDSAELSAAAR
jgi:alpha-L-fucosidase